MTSEDSTEALLENRQSVYGPRVTNMEQVAAIWSAMLDHKIEDWQVPLLMSAYKMFRTFRQPDYSDNSDDIDGWKVMFVEVMEANHGGIVQARTVEEYKAKLAAKPKQMTLDDVFGPIITPPVGDPHDIAVEPLTEELVQEVLDQQELAESRRPPAYRNMPEARPIRVDQSEGLMMERWLRNRCGAETGLGPCMDWNGHHGYCTPSP